MKIIVFTCLLVALLAVNPLEKYEELARQDDCVANVFDLLKPEIDAKLETLKTVLVSSLSNTTSPLKLNSSPSSKKESKCSTSAMPTSPNPNSEMLSNGTELPSSSPQTASRMSELSSSSLTLSSKAPLTGPTMLSLPSSDTSLASKVLLTAPNLSTSSSDRIHHI